MSKELLLVVDAVANEKGVPREVIFDAIEAALASAAKKRYPDQEVLARVSINHKDGTYETFRRWEVVADDVVMESPDRQVRLMDAIDESEGAEVGDYIREKGFGFSAERFVAYYDSNGWKVGKGAMKDWKAACRTWQLNHADSAPSSTTALFAGDI